LSISWTHQLSLPRPAVGSTTHDGFSEPSTSTIMKTTSEVTPPATQRFVPLSSSP
jgi:hypothetical protein